MLAIKQKRTDVAVFLLEQKCDVRVIDRHGKSALFYAKEHGDAHLVKLLGECGLSECVWEIHSDCLLLIFSLPVYVFVLGGHVT